MAVERVSPDSYSFFAAVSQVFDARCPSVHEFGDLDGFAKRSVEQAFWQAFLDGFLHYGPTRDLLINCRIVLCGQNSTTKKRQFWV